MFNVKTHLTMIRRLALGLPLVFLVGCQSDVLIEDDYEPVTAAERFPIRVETASVKTGLRAPSGVLSAEQVNAVFSFGTTARRTASSRIYIKYPSASGNMRKAAGEAAQILRDQGIPSAMITVAAYHGSSRQPIMLSFERKVAVTKECGDWSADIGSDMYNQSHVNFGCAVQNNVAAMVANPEDFEQPRSVGPLLAANRTENMKIYVTNSTSGDYWTHDSESKSQ